MANIDARSGDPVASAGNAQLFTRIAHLGEYFALPAPTDGGWKPFALLLDHSAMRDYVDRTQQAIAASMNCDVSQIPLRLAASSFQLGVAARVLSPVIGAATCLQAVPLLGADSVWWRAVTEPGAARHSPRFSVAGAASVDAGTAAVAASAICSSLVSGLLLPLSEALVTTTGLSTKVMSGNVISAANGAVTVLAMSRPQDEPRGRALVAALSETEELADTGHFERGSFFRHSCCLFYQAPHAGLCGDCILALS